MMIEETLIKEKINQETSKILWSELQRFFANGSAIFVAAELDLVTVSDVFSNDNKIQVEQWLNNKQVHKVTDEQAIIWLEQDIMVWAVVIKPWILIQAV